MVEIICINWGVQPRWGTSKLPRDIFASKLAAFGFGCINICFVCIYCASSCRWYCTKKYVRSTYQFIVNQMWTTRLRLMYIRCTGCLSPQWGPLRAARAREAGSLQRLCSFGWRDSVLAPPREAALLARGRPAARAPGREDVLGPGDKPAGPAFFSELMETSGFGADSCQKFG